MSLAVVGYMATAFGVGERSVLLGCSLKGPRAYHRYPVVRSIEHWGSSCLSSLSQHLNANTITNTMHYLKATVLDPTRSFSIT